MKLQLTACALAAKSCSAAALTSSNSTSNAIAHIPYEYTYLLPDGFTGNGNETFVNSTRVPGNDSINALLQAASYAPLIPYTSEFSRLVGSNPQLTLISDRTAANDSFAYEAGVWVPERDEIWLTSAPQQATTRPSTVYALNLNTSAIAPLNTTGEQLRDCDGGYYFEGAVYFASYPTNTSGTYRGGILRVDVHTLQVTTVVNSYFGLHFNGPDDIVWVTNPRNCSEKYMFFTDFDYSPLSFDSESTPPQLPNAVYRWDPLEEILLPVISRNELIPNGIRVSPDMKTLYVTDGGAKSMGTSDSSWLGPYIYKYSFDENMLPQNRRLFGQVRYYIADGMHVDDQGRVWTGEGDGIVVRSPKGKVLGAFNSQYFLADRGAGRAPIANFALAGDSVIVLAGTRLWRVKVAEVLVAKGSGIVN